MKTLAIAPILGALLLLPSCGTSGGLDSQSNISAASLPLVGTATDAAVQTVQTADRVLGRVAVDVATAPFRAIEGTLGLDPAQVRSAEDLSGRYSPEERLSRRREARGLPAPPEMRVARRQTSRRYAERYRAAGQASGTTLGR